MNRGDRVGKHRHDNAHTAFLIRGAARASLGDAGRFDETDLIAPARFFVPGGMIHDFEALADDTLIWCVFVGEDR